jgi:hypothetical protein
MPQNEKNKVPVNDSFDYLRKSLNNINNQYKHSTEHWPRHDLLPKGQWSDKSNSASESTFCQQQQA